MPGWSASVVAKAPPGPFFSCATSNVRGSLLAQPALHDLARDVETRLGHPVFVSAAQADLSVEGRIEPAKGGPGWHAILVLRDAAGATLGTREITRNEPDFSQTGARGDPTIIKRQAKTEMLVRDGDTAVIGGIYTRNSGLSYTKVPWFADIPVIGWLFKSQRSQQQSTDLYFFVTPTML